MNATESPTTDARLLRLAPEDNVLTALAAFEAGTAVFIQGRRVTLAQNLPFGHKVAARDIAAGEKVVKYGAPIGSATHFIACGTQVHTHNLRSDYLPTYLHRDQARYFNKEQG
jgi:altronate dehydratase small subunit